MFSIFRAHYCWVAYRLCNFDTCTNCMYVSSFSPADLSDSITPVSIQSVLSDGDIVALPVGAVANNSAYK